MEGNAQEPKRMINMREALKNMEDEAREIGEIRGEAKAETASKIKELILVYKECHVSDEEILARLMKK